jgi:carboxypeptidase family protein
MTFSSWAAPAIAILAAAMFSGCVGGGKSDLDRPNATAVFDDETGAIRGQVLNEEAIGVAGADVGILALSVATKTDESGMFFLNMLPPGTHEVHVSALGFEPQMRPVEVRKGAATDLIAFQLIPMPSDAPYHRTIIKKATLSGLMWKLTPECIYTDVNPLVKTCGGVRLNSFPPGSGTVTAGCAACEMHTLDRRNFTDFNNHWESIVGEVSWTPQSGASGKGFLFDVNAPNITRGSGGSINQADKHTWFKAANKGYIQIRVDKDALTSRPLPEKDWNNYNATEDRCVGKGEYDGRRNCDWFFRLFPAAYDLGNGPDQFGPDYGIMFENTATMYISYFVREKAAPDFTALPR